ncbi:uncharacterized protein LOC135819939 isoform X2 [Sycon ciliatum]|uniref:uncharacterized protein LOC135819939 isoform X2 n=1 Tax=Sycon ciliatum TaxID=27933 RepID=UPI0031F6E308
MMSSSNSPAAVCVLLAFLASVGYVQAQTAYPGCNPGSPAGPACFCEAGKVHSEQGCIDFAVAAIAGGIGSGTSVNIDVYTFAQVTTRTALLGQTLDSKLSLKTSLTGSVNAVTVIWAGADTNRLGRPLLVLSAGSISSFLSTLILADWRNVIRISPGNTSNTSTLAISLDFIPGQPVPPGLKIEQRLYSEDCYTLTTLPATCTYAEFKTGSSLAFGDYEFFASVEAGGLVIPLTVPFRVIVQAWNARISQPQCLGLSVHSCYCTTGYAFLRDGSCAPAGKVLIDEGHATAGQEMEVQVFNFSGIAPPTGSAKRSVTVTNNLTLPELAFSLFGHVIIGNSGQSVVASFADMQVRQLVAHFAHVGYQNSSAFITESSPGIVTVQTSAVFNASQYRPYSANCYSATTTMGAGGSGQCAWLNLNSTAQALAGGDYELLLSQTLPALNMSSYLLPPFPFSVRASSSAASVLPSAFLMLAVAMGVLVF